MCGLNSTGRLIAATLCMIKMLYTVDFGCITLPVESAPFFIPSTSFYSLSSWFTSSYTHHLITVTTVALITYWLGLLTCKNRLPYNLYCVGGDVKHCSLTHALITYHCLYLSLQT